MGGHIRLLAISLGAIAFLAGAAPATALAGPPAANHGSATHPDSGHGPKSGQHGEAQPEASAAATAASASADQPTSSGDDAHAGATVPANEHERLSVPGQIERAARGEQPAGSGKHVAPLGRGRHFGAGIDRADNVASGAGATASRNGGGESEPAPSTGTQAAATEIGQRLSSTRQGGTTAAPPVIVAPPPAPQPRTPLGVDQVLTGARLDWILVGVVIALAAAVAAAVRLATHRGRRPQG